MFHSPSEFIYHEIYPKVSSGSAGSHVRHPNHKKIKLLINSNKYRHEVLLGDCVKFSFPEP